MKPLSETFGSPSRFASDDELARREEKIRAAQEYERRVWRRESRTAFESYIPPAYAGATLDAPWLRERVGDAALAAAKSSLAAPRVVFAGPSAAGKTSLAVAMLRARNDFTARFIHCVKLAHARFRDAEYVEMALTAPLIVLDDLCEETGTSANAANPIPDVINLRHAENLPFWVTTGHSPKTIERQYGAGRARRIFEGAITIPLAGPLA